MLLMNLSDLEVKLANAKQELEEHITKLRHLEGAVMLLNSLINEERGKDGTNSEPAAPVRDAEVGDTEEAGGTPEGDVGPA